MYIPPPPRGYTYTLTDLAKARQAVYQHLPPASRFVPITLVLADSGLFLLRTTTHSTTSLLMFSGSSQLTTPLLTGTNSPNPSLPVQAHLVPADLGNYSISVELALDTIYQTLLQLQPRLALLGYDAARTVWSHPQGDPVVDWTLNIHRCIMFVTMLPAAWHGQVPQVQRPPRAVHPTRPKHKQRHHRFRIHLIPALMLDEEFVELLALSDLYVEHKLDPAFRKHVASVSVEQTGRLVASPSIPDLVLQRRAVALRNYVINLGCAAQTAVEFKAAARMVKLARLREWAQHSGLVADPAAEEHAKLLLAEKQQLWDKIRSEVFSRSGLGDTN